jgi:hypothetical protein
LVSSVLERRCADGANVHREDTSDTVEPKGWHVKAVDDPEVILDVDFVRALCQPVRKKKEVSARLTSGQDTESNSRILLLSYVGLVENRLSAFDLRSSETLDAPSAAEPGTQSRCLAETPAARDLLDGSRSTISFASLAPLLVVYRRTFSSHVLPCQVVA